VKPSGFGETKMDVIFQIPCTRYDHDGTDARVAMTIAQAVLRAGSNAEKEFVASVISVHDHKGELDVLCRKPISKALMFAICSTWEDFACEAMDSVNFSLEDVS
jgi:hypothetical protein